MSEKTAVIDLRARVANLERQLLAAQMDRDEAIKQAKQTQAELAELRRTLRAVRTVCEADYSTQCATDVLRLIPPRLVAETTSTAPPKADACNCQSLDGGGPWHPMGDTPSCPTRTGAVPATAGADEQTTPTRHGWTSHGYACCGLAAIGERPNARARCMGNPRCRKCSDEADAIHAAPVSAVPATDDTGHGNGGFTELAARAIETKTPLDIAAALHAYGAADDQPAS